MKLWLDDIRIMPKGFDLWAKSFKEAVSYLDSGKITFISLDHDLGENVKSGYDVACYIERLAMLKSIPKLNWVVHSANPIGAERIKTAMEKADEFFDGRKP